MTPEAAAAAAAGGDDSGRIEECAKTISKHQMDIRSSVSDKKSVPISSKHENLKYKRENDVDLLFSDRIIPTDSSIFWKWLFETQLTKGSDEFLQFIAHKVSQEKKLLYEVHTHNLASYLNNFLQYNGEISLRLICDQIMELKPEDLNKLRMLETFLSSIQLLLEYYSNDYCTLGLSLFTKSQSFSRRFVQYLMNNPRIIMKLFDEIKKFNIDKDSALNALCIISLHASDSDFLQFINSETLYIQIESFSDESPPNIISNILYVLVSILLVNIQSKSYCFHDLHALNLSTILSLSHHAYLLTNSFAHTYFTSLGKLIDKYEKCNTEILREVCSPERRMRLVEKDLVFASILKSMMEFIINIIRHGKFNLHFIWNLLRNEHLFLQLLNIVERKRNDEDGSESLDISNREFILNYIVRLKTLLIDYKIFDITDGEMNEHQSNNLQPAIDNLDIEIPKNVRYFKFEKSSMLFSFHNIAWERVELHSHLKIQ
ncbi:MAG: hypothetical protein MHMPM18_000260 [Marteilia pararefringens]